MSDTDEPLIKFLQEHMDGIEVYNSWRDFPDINDREEFPDDTQSLIILDDFVTDVKDQKRLEKAIISMRKRGISCVMLVQNFIQLNITVRKNLSHLFIKRLGTKREAKAILDAYSLGGIDADTLISIYKQCIETDSGDNTGFMTVDLTNPDLMFRKCLQPLELPSS